TTTLLTVNQSSCCPSAGSTMIAMALVPSYPVARLGCTTEASIITGTAMVPPAGNTEPSSPSGKRIGDFKRGTECCTEQQSTRLESCAEARKQSGFGQLGSTLRV